MTGKTSGATGDAPFIEVMPPCHATPFIRLGVVIAPAAGQAPEQPPGEEPFAECCDYCGSAQLQWRKCKLICADCRQINKSCADL